jgi:diguanylate cyclase (GGDEF)-like protein
LTVRSKTLRNPLEEVPSILAVRDIRHRARQAMHRYRGATAIEEELLALDPLTVLRCMRVAHSPVMGLPAELLTIAGLRSALGRPVLHRALEARVGDVAGSGSLRALWMHAIATAHAARMLAARDGNTDPERAYVLGLLHDLPLWLHYLSLRRTGRAPAASAEDWIASWNLPPVLAAVAQRPLPEDTAGSPTALIAAAERLAELAGFSHPDADGSGEARAGAAQEDLDAACSVRDDVALALETFGLETAANEPQQPVALAPESSSLFPAHRQGRIEDVVRSMLDCADSARYRGILTAMTASGLRYLDYERAFFVQWTPANGACFLRAKADLTLRALTPCRVMPNDRELLALERARDSGQPQCVRARADDASGLLQMIGCDEILLTPVTRNFLVCGFLITDRALSARPIHAHRESAAMESLARIGELLVQNLLLKRRRDRAQKFALTDPLTRLFNRGVGITNLSQEIARAKRNGTPLTVLMMDMDDFKNLNDTYGHLAGDDALRRAANVARRALRRGDTICRYGGEEFLVILPETSIEEASVTATRLFTAIREEGERLGIALSVSIGLASVRPEDDLVESVLSRADRALYASKARGRNRFSVDGD